MSEQKWSTEFLNVAVDNGRRELREQIVQEILAWKTPTNFVFPAGSWMSWNSNLDTIISRIKEVK